MCFHRNRVYIHLAVSRAITMILEEASKIKDIFLRIFFSMLWYYMVAWFKKKN